MAVRGLAATGHAEKRREEKTQEEKRQEGTRAPLRLARPSLPRTQCLGACIMLFGMSRVFWIVLVFGQDQIETKFF